MGPFFLKLCTTEVPNTTTNSLAVQRQPLGVRHLGAVLPPLPLLQALVVEHLVLQLDLPLRVLHVEADVVHLGHDVGEGVAQPQRPPLQLLAARAQALDLLLKLLHSAKVGMNATHVENVCLSEIVSV